MDFKLINKIESFINKFDESGFIINHNKAEVLTQQRSDSRNILSELSRSISDYKISKVFSAAGLPSHLHALECSHWIEEAILHGVVVEKPKMDSGFRIFIGSTMYDLQLERQRIASEVARSENIPILAEHMIDVQNSPRKAIEDKVDDCQAYIGIFHKKWGHIPPDHNPGRLSVTAIEYERATTRNIPRLVLISNYEKEKELEDFIKKISNMETGVLRQKYENSDELILKVARGIPHLVRAIISKRSTLEATKSIHPSGPPVYTNRTLLEGDSDLFICKLYQRVRHIMEESKNALEIYKSLGIGGVDDQEQGTREVVQELSRKRPSLIGKAVEKDWDVFLTEEGLEYCEKTCDQPWIRNRISQ